MWYRHYDETLVDAKILIIAQDLKVSWLVVHGAWAAILCLASRSPVRGALMVTRHRPYTLCNVSEAFRVTLPETEALFQAFENAEMLRLEGDTWHVNHWDKRQRESDSSTNRVRKHREMKRIGNVTETPQKQIQSTETEGKGAACAPAAVSDPPPVKPVTEDRSGSVRFEPDPVSLKLLEQLHPGWARGQLTDPLAQWHGAMEFDWPDIRAAVQACIDQGPKIDNKIRWITQRLVGRREDARKGVGNGRSKSRGQPNCYGRPGISAIGK